MRARVEPATLQRALDRLGTRARGAGRVYLTGGACALLMGWRSSTADIDLRLDPEPRGLFEAIRDLKRELNINIELASPQDFLPELPGWRSRSLFIRSAGRVSFYHYDFYAQALSKLLRHHARDLDDAGHMVRDGLVEPPRLLDLFERIRGDLLRYPAIDEDIFHRFVRSFVRRHQQGGDGE